MKNWKKEKSVFDPPDLSGLSMPYRDSKDTYGLPISPFTMVSITCTIPFLLSVRILRASDLLRIKPLTHLTKNFKWVDHGKVIQSVPGRDLWNAIDPNLAWDEKQQPWLVFGSFWSGMKLVKLSPTLDKVAQPEEWKTVSKRPRDFKVDDENAGDDGAVEAPFIFKKNNFYYLFVSFDFCCRGLKSTYKIMVGRNQKKFRNLC